MNTSCGVLSVGGRSGWRKSLTVLAIFLGFTPLPLSAECLRGDCQNGVGIYQWSSGDRYQGQFKDGQRHGRGQYIHRDGSVYTGEYFMGQRQGQGTLVWSSGKRYSGSWNQGLQQGQGRKSWPDGRVQTGRFDRDRFMGGLRAKGTRETPKANEKPVQPKETMKPKETIKPKEVTQPTREPQKSGATTPPKETPRTKGVTPPKEPPKPMRDHGGTAPRHPEKAGPSVPVPGSAPALPKPGQPIPASAPAVPKPGQPIPAPSSAVPKPGLPKSGASKNEEQRAATIQRSRHRPLSLNKGKIGQPVQPVQPVQPIRQQVPSDPGKGNPSVRQPSSSIEGETLSSPVASALWHRELAWVYAVPNTPPRARQSGNQKREPVGSTSSGSVVNRPGSDALAARPEKGPLGKKGVPLTVPSGQGQAVAVMTPVPAPEVAGKVKPGQTVAVMTPAPMPEVAGKAKPGQAVAVMTPAPMPEVAGKAKPGQAVAVMTPAPMPEVAGKAKPGRAVAVEPMVMAKADMDAMVMPVTTPKPIIKPDPVTLPEPIPMVRPGAVPPEPKPLERSKRQLDNQGTPQTVVVQEDPAKPSGLGESGSADDGNGVRAAAPVVAFTAWEMAVPKPRVRSTPESMLHASMSLLDEVRPRSRSKEMVPLKSTKVMSFVNLQEGMLDEDGLGPDAVDSPLVASAFRDLPMPSAERILDAEDELNQLLKEGRAQNEKGQFNRAIYSFTCALGLKPNDPDAHHGRGMALLKLGMPDRAIRDFDAALEEDPSRFETLLERGMTLRQLKDYKGSLRDLGLVLVRPETGPEPFVERALTFMEMGRYEEALADLQQALVKEPKLDRAHYVRGIVLAKSGRSGEAVESFNTAIVNNPDDAHYYFERANAIAASGQIGQAIGDYDKAIALEGDDAEYYFARGFAHQSLNNVDDMCRDLKSACDRGDIQSCDVVQVKCR
ncbi:MAG: tetratricopeptide repeat protein [Magnetococcales bacterium]|nr:tetratricopeptide repeat protein [Magnetococcales bacterium]